MTYLGLRPGEKLYEELLVKTEELDKTENSMIFIERDRNFKGFATELDSIRMIAKISVLQADFNEFYDTLFLNMNAMEEIVEVYRGENDSPSEEVGRFFENIDERYELKPKYQSLINYLIHTEKSKLYIAL